MSVKFILMFHVAIICSHCFIYYIVWMHLNLSILLLRDWVIFQDLVIMNNISGNIWKFLQNINPEMEAGYRVCRVCSALLINAKLFSRRLSLFTPLFAEYKSSCCLTPFPKGPKSLLFSVAQSYVPSECQPFDWFSEAQANSHFPWLLAPSQYRVEDSDYP